MGVSLNRSRDSVSGQIESFNINRSITMKPKKEEKDGRSSSHSGTSDGYRYFNALNFEVLYTENNIAYIHGVLGRNYIINHSNYNERSILLFLHANGFCKEIWMSTLNYLHGKIVSSFGSQDNLNIDRGNINEMRDVEKLKGSGVEFIAIDFSGHGDSRPLSILIPLLLLILII